MKHDMYAAPASAVSSAWLGEKTSVMFTGMPSAASTAWPRGRPARTAP